MTTEQRKAILVIKNYLNNSRLTDDCILENYDLAVEQLINNAAKLENIKTPGVKSVSEGNQSINFQSGTEAWSITADVKGLLPVPYVRMW